MKRTIVLFAALAAAMLLSTSALGQDEKPLGDYARSVRKQQPPQKAHEGKRFDNDNLPQNTTINVVGQAPAETKDSANPDQPVADASADANAADANKDQGEKKAAGVPAGDDAAAKNAQNDEWKKNIGAQKDQIDLLTRELDVLQREYRLRAAAMYADVGNRLRNSADWDKQDAEYKQKIADKQKAVDEAKQKLDDMQEQARKAGVPSSARE
ncbi:MAG TPA: hypothetical protein VFA89_14600 [Terriglobales bacterium]|nr:hypothetical protein [Terriglobales bacterium]